MDLVATGKRRRKCLLIPEDRKGAKREKYPTGLCWEAWLGVRWEMKDSLLSTHLLWGQITIKACRHELPWEGGMRLLTLTVLQFVMVSALTAGELGHIWNPLQLFQELLEGPTKSHSDLPHQLPCCDRGSLERTSPCEETTSNNSKLEGNPPCRYRKQRGLAPSSDTWHSTAPQNCDRATSQFHSPD